MKLRVFPCYFPVFVLKFFFSYCSTVHCLIWSICHLASVLLAINSGFTPPRWGRHSECPSPLKCVKTHLVGRGRFRCALKEVSPGCSWVESPGQSVKPIWSLVLFEFAVFLSIFCLSDPSVIENVVLNSPIIVLLSISPFRSINTWGFLDLRWAHTTCNRLPFLLSWLLFNITQWRCLPLALGSLLKSIFAWDRHGHSHTLRAKIYIE